MYMLSFYLDRLIYYLTKVSKKDKIVKNELLQEMNNYTQKWNKEIKEFLEEKKKEKNIQ